MRKNPSIRSVVFLILLLLGSGGVYGGKKTGKAKAGIPVVAGISDEGDQVGKTDGMTRRKSARLRDKKSGTDGLDIDVGDEEWGKWEKKEDVVAVDAEDEKQSDKELDSNRADEGSAPNNEVKESTVIHIEEGSKGEADSDAAVRMLSEDEDKSLIDGFEKYLEEMNLLYKLIGEEGSQEDEIYQGMLLDFHKRNYPNTRRYNGDVALQSEQLQEGGNFSSQVDNRLLPEEDMQLSADAAGHQQSGNEEKPTPQEQRQQLLPEKSISKPWFLSRIWNYFRGKDSGMVRLESESGGQVEVTVWEIDSDLAIPDDQAESQQTTSDDREKVTLAEESGGSPAAEESAGISRESVDSKGESPVQVPSDGQKAISSKSAEENTDENAIAVSYGLDDMAMEKITAQYRYPKWISFTWYSGLGAGLSRLLDYRKRIVQFLSVGDEEVSSQMYFPVGTSGQWFVSEAIPVESDGRHYFVFIEKKIDDVVVGYDHIKADGTAMKAMELNVFVSDAVSGNKPRLNRSSDLLFGIHFNFDEFGDVTNKTPRGKLKLTGPNVKPEDFSNLEPLPFNPPSQGEIDSVVESHAGLIAKRYSTNQLEQEQDVKAYLLRPDFIYSDKLSDGLYLALNENVFIEQVVKKLVGLKNTGEVLGQLAGDDSPLKTTAAFRWLSVNHGKLVEWDREKGTSKAGRVVIRAWL